MILIQSLSKRLSYAGFVVALGGASLVQSAEVEDQAIGYYPTYLESSYLATRDYDYERGAGGALNGPDLDRLAATGGIWPYEYNAGQLSKLQRFMQPVDYILRPFTPGETIAFQGPTSESWFQLGGAFPFLTRTYHPEKSSFADLFGMEATKYSPFFFDVLNISFYAAYADNSGLPPGESEFVDGKLLSALSLTFRVGWGLTDRTSLIIGGQVFVILTDETDVRFFINGGELSALVDLNIQFELGNWDLRVFDQLRPFSSKELILGESSNSGDLNWGGRHFMPVPSYPDSSDWWEESNYFLTNVLGLTTGSWVSSSIRFLAGFSRFDTWKFSDFNETSGHEITSAGLFYDGYDLWVAPALTYSLFTTDLGNPEHQVLLSGSAPLSPNITVSGAAGYNFGDLYDGYRWSFSVNYNQSARLRHQFYYESGYQNSLIGNAFTGNTMSYVVHYLMGPRVTLSGMLGWYSDNSGKGDGFSAGGTLNVALGNYSWLRIAGGYLDVGSISGNNSDPSSYFYDVTLARRIAERLEGQLSYQFIQNASGKGADRSVIMLQLSRSF